jgi:hypothetical protein
MHLKFYSNTSVSIRMKISLTLLKFLYETENWKEILKRIGGILQLLVTNSLKIRDL